MKLKKQRHDKGCNRMIKRMIKMQQKTQPTKCEMFIVWPFTESIPWSLNDVEGRSNGVHTFPLLPNRALFSVT